MSNYNSVNFAELEAQLNNIRQQHTTFEQNAQQLIQTVAGKKATWTGSAREQWDVTEQRWNQDMEIMRNKLEQAGIYLRNSHDRMTQDEGRNRGLFGM